MMKNRILSVLLVLALVLSMGFGVVHAEEPQAVTYQESGRSSVAKLSLAELQALVDSVPGYDTLFAQTPVLSGSYRIGTLTTAAYNSTAAIINYYRTVAGLAPITLNQEANTSSAWGALVMAMGDDFNHYPHQPDGMSDADYEKGYYATSHSNISWSYGFGAENALAVAVVGQLEDSDEGNITALGHRRWLLNPGIQTMGVGCSVGHDSREYFTDVTVMGQYVSTNKVTDYEFISWPASGYNLSDTFTVEVPWSITLNPDRYSAPSASSVKVVLTEERTGKTWTFDKNTGTNAGEGYDYFNVDNNGYAVANCIIFRPAFSNLNEFFGNYTVKVTGLTNKSGKSVELNYLVKFASMDSDPEPCQHTNTTVAGAQPAQCDQAGYTGDVVCADCGVTLSTGSSIPALGHIWNDGGIGKEPGHLEEGLRNLVCARCGKVTTEPIRPTCPTLHFTDVGRTSWYHSAVDFVVERSIMSGTSGTTFAPNVVMTRAEVAQLFYNLAGKPGFSGTNPFSDVPNTAWFRTAVAWCAANGVVSGSGAGRFDPYGVVTREQVVSMLYRYSKQTPIPNDALGGFSDAGNVSSWAREAVNWAVINGIMNGSGGQLLPGSGMTRAEVAQLMKGYMTKIVGV